jgi:hypothetical protein
MNHLFGTALMDTTEWAWVLTSGGLAIYMIVGAEKWLQRRTGNEIGK